MYNKSVMKKIFVSIILLVVLSFSVCAVDLCMSTGFGLTVGSPYRVHIGFVSNFVFDKNFFNNNRDSYSTVQVLLGYDMFTLGYGCLLPNHPSHTNEDIDRFFSVLSIGYNIKLIDEISLLASVTISSRSEVGVSLSMLFNLGVFTAPYENESLKK